ncbi:hypothetical protein KVL36_00485 [Helicobacter pylori]|nr:hypothetical protein KVL36_00485 [Helicobacter pylori]
MKKVFLGMALAISFHGRKKRRVFRGRVSMFGNNQTAPAQETQSASKPDTKVNPSASWMKK